MKLGIIARCDKTGLGFQTLRLCRMLNPTKVLLIDSTPFNGNEQHPEWYFDFDTTIVKGFMSDAEATAFCKQVDVVLSAEIFYNSLFTEIATKNNTQTVLHANPEFFDWFTPGWRFISLPTKVIVPSRWLLHEMNNVTDTEYLPTPILPDEFKETAKHNTKRRFNRFLFMNGKTAAEDRNGLQDLYRAMEKSKGDFTVTIKAQHDVQRHPDPRLKYDFSNPDIQEDLYRGFDLMIQPRRYGGQTLSMTEALSCGLPVLMPLITPNYDVLPPEWLYYAKVKSTLRTRLDIPVYESDAEELAQRLDTFCGMSDGELEMAKLKALKLSKQYSPYELKPKYERVLYGH